MKQGQQGTLVRRQRALGHAEGMHEAHFLNALQGRGLGVASLALALGRREIARRQPGVVVGGSDQPVEVDLLQGHVLMPLEA